MDLPTLLVDRDGPVVTVTMNRPERRNALSLDHLAELLQAFDHIGESDARGVVLAANGPVFSAGHDFADMDGADLAAMRRLLQHLHRPDADPARPSPRWWWPGCTPWPPRPAASWWRRATWPWRPSRPASPRPGGKAGWFCTTPMVAIGRTMGRKRALELALTGDTIDAATAADWGLVNRVVPDAELDAAVDDLLGRATRGSAVVEGAGQAGLPHPDRHGPAPGLRLRRRGDGRGQPDRRTPSEGVAAFLEKRPTDFPD